MAWQSTRILKNASAFEKGESGKVIYFKIANLIIHISYKLIYQIYIIFFVNNMNEYLNI